MGYRSNIRIITSKEGYKKLEEFVKEFLEKNNERYNLLEELNIKEEGKKEYYLGWDYVKWYDSFPSVEAIMEGLNFLGKNEYSYRYVRIGESYDDIEEQFYDGVNDNKLFLEHPSMIREFDDEYLLGLINQKQLEELEENKEEIDI